MYYMDIVLSIFDFSPIMSNKWSKWVQCKINNIELVVWSGNLISTVIQATSNFQTSIFIVYSLVFILFYISVKIFLKGYGRVMLLVIILHNRFDLKTA